MQYIKNKKQMFATYNIYNAVKNYCNNGDIVALLDGDDELVGRQVFRFLNSMYQRYKYWYMYTNYFRSDLTYGGSKPVDTRFYIFTKRTRFHMVSPLRTFSR